MNPQFLDVENWRISSKAEVLNFLKSKSPPNQSGRIKKNTGSALIFRTHLRPVDIYSYLKARFGAPNGVQTYLRSDDSDNLFHWDYNIKAGVGDIYILGASRQIHFHLSEKIEDSGWGLLLRTIKRDFARIAKGKSTILKSFEKWAVFENKFAIIAENCAELHENILEAPEFDSRRLCASNKKILGQSLRRIKDTSKRAATLHGDCLKLRLLTPIMSEAFIALFIITFCKDEVRRDKGRYTSFMRARIPDRLELLYQNCHSMISPVDKKSDSYKNFMTIINERNDLIHGNMHPEKDFIEIVYFEGKQPIYQETGDQITKFFEQLEKLYDPSRVIENYENAHLFLFELIRCLHPKAHSWFLNIMNDSYPGFEMRQKRITRLFPSHLATVNFPGMRFDDELEIEW